MAKYLVNYVILFFSVTYCNHYTLLIMPLIYLLFTSG